MKPIIQATPLVWMLRVGAAAAGRIQLHGQSSALLTVTISGLVQGSMQGQSDCLAMKVVFDAVL
jgi:hypothetical protein